MRDRSQPSPSPAPTLPSAAPSASCPTDRPRFDDATLIMRLKTGARDYMATAERNAYQQRQLVDQLLPGRARQSACEWEVAGGGEERVRKVACPLMFYLVGA